MKAYVLKSVGDIALKEVEKPSPKRGEVLIRVMAAGICGSDIPRIYDTGAHVMPLILGHEFSGEVVEIGEAVNPGWLLKAVGVFPLIPCHECPSCLKLQYEMCKNYSYLGSRQDGAFSEYVIVPENNLIELPESVSFEEAAMLEPMAVAVHAMRRAAFSEFDNVFVLGLGTIGLLLTMFLKEAGVKRLYVIGNKDFQRERATALGISSEYFLDSRDEDIVEWIQR